MTDHSRSVKESYRNAKSAVLERFTFTELIARRRRGVHRFPRDPAFRLSHPSACTRARPATATASRSCTHYQCHALPTRYASVRTGAREEGVPPDLLGYLTRAPLPPVFSSHFQRQKAGWLKGVPPPTHEPVDFATTRDSRTLSEGLGVFRKRCSPRPRSRAHSVGRGPGSTSRCELRGMDSPDR